MNMYKRLLALGLCCLAIATVGAYFFARRLTIPLISLRQVTEQVAEGNLDTRSEISTGDEVEDLAESFNEMTKSLQKSTIELTTANKQLEQEITERKRVEEALRIEKEFTELLINSSADGILAFDKDCRYTVWNKGMERISGLSRAETLGKCAFDVFPFLKEIGEDRYFFETLSGKNVVTKERSYIIPESGQKGFFEGYYSPLYNASDKVIGGLAIIIDITKRRLAEEALKESEGKYRKLIETALDAIICIDEKGIISVWNKSAERTFGYSKSETEGQPITIIIPEKYKKEHQKGLERFLKTGEAKIINKTIEVSGRTKEGAEIPIEMSLSFRKIGEGKYAFTATIRDITLRKKAEKQIKESLREKEILLQEIHHRVKNNLQVIISLLRLQSKNIEDQKILQMFQESQDRINSMALVYEKIYRSKNLARIKLKGYVEDLANDLFRNYGVNTGKIALKIDVGDISMGIDTAIPCGLIINELLTNSLKYAFPEGRKGKIKIEISPTNEDEIEMIIGDNGIGLREEFDYRKSPGFGFRMIVDLVEYKLMGRIKPIHNEGIQFQILFKEIRY
ncbi:MAG: PAS domain S-box protein, partial [Candidatus Scalindua sp.]